MSKTKVLFLKKDGQIVDYRPEEHCGLIYKFLYWKDLDLLIAGEKSWRCQTHKHLRDNVNQSPKERPDGAGACFSDGVITSWDSSGFKFDTPDELKDIIKEAFKTTEGPYRCLD